MHFWPAALLPFLHQAVALPLLRVTLGFSGAWIGKLRGLEAYSHYFLGLAWVAMVFAYRRIYRPVVDCKPGEVCAIPQVRVTYKVIC